MEEEPAILPIEAPQARFHFTRPARSQNGSPAFEQLRQVVGVDRGLPPPAIGFVNAQASVFAPALIEEVDVAVKARSPYQSGKRIDDAAELDLHSGPFVTYAETRICAPLRADVHHTLVSVCGEMEASSRDCRHAR
jgi:hypothetical protein